MLTECIIDTLKNDATLRGLLGASTAANSPIMASFSLIEVTNKAISVGVVYGESEETGYEHGIINIEVYVHNSVTNNAPVKMVSDISKRVIVLLDLKGSQLNGTLATKVYRLRKTAFDMLYDDISKCHVGILNFEFYVTL